MGYEANPKNRLYQTVSVKWGVSTREDNKKTANVKTGGAKRLFNDVYCSGRGGWESTLFLFRLIYIPFPVRSR